MFASLFTDRTRPRCYALVDRTGLCQAFHQARNAPLGTGWVEVTECRLSWLQRPLPFNARLQPCASAASSTRTRQPLSV
ncbi:MAG: hypothetical protein V4812_20375 [Pseudomonadota bacterium]